MLWNDLACDYIYIKLLYGPWVWASQMTMFCPNVKRLDSPEPRSYYFGQCSTAVKRHHDHDNSYNRKRLIGAGLQFQRFNSLLSWWEAWRHPGRHGAREELGVLSTFGPAGSRREKTVGLAWASETPKPTLSDTLPPTTTPWWPSIQIYEPMRAILIQTTMCTITVSCSNICSIKLRRWWGKDNGISTRNERVICRI